jgi:hypothetical protein
MISIGHDVDRDADATGHHHLVTGAMNGFDQSPAEFSGVLKVECDQTRRRMALIEGVDRFNENRSSVRQKQQLADRFAGREKIGPLIKVTLISCFGLNSAMIRGAGLIAIICARLLVPVGFQIVRSPATWGKPVRRHTLTDQTDPWPMRSAPRAGRGRPL